MITDEKLEKPVAWRCSPAVVLCLRAGGRNSFFFRRCRYLFWVLGSTVGHRLVNKPVVFKGSWCGVRVISAMKSVVGYPQKIAADA